MLFLLNLLPGLLSAQPENWSIRYYSTEDGLTSNHINSIVRDNRGIIWVGTENGLNWFDGYAFKQLKYASGQKHALSQIKILSIYEDDQDLLWVGTVDGLFRYDPSESVDHIRQYRYRESGNNEAIVQTQPVNRICEDKNGLLWMNSADTDDGVRPDLIKFNKTTEEFTILDELRIIGEDLRELDGPEIVVDVYADRSKTIWLATYNGLYKYIPEENAYKNYIPFPGNPRPQVNLMLKAFEDSFGNLWASDVCGLLQFDRENETYGDPIILNEQVGLYGNQSAVYYIDEDADGYLWMRVNEELMRLLPDPSEEKKLRIIDRWMPEAGNLTSILERMTLLIENPHSIWMTVAHRGLCHISVNRNSFSIIEPNSLGINYSEQVNNVTALHADSLNNLWLSTAISGPTIYNLMTDEVENAGLSPFNMVNEIDMDAEGNLWLASRYGIHHRIEKGKYNINQLVSYEPDSSRANSLTRRIETDQYGNASVSTNLFEHILYKDRQGNLWINSGTGIHDRYVPETDDFIHLDHRIADHFNNDTCMAERDDEIWFPTMRGLLRIIPPFTHVSPHTIIPEHAILYRKSDDERSSLNSSWVKTTCISQHCEPGTMWIATIGGGLNKMVKQPVEGSDAIEVHFEHYTEADGLCNNNILGIIEDREGNLWLSTLNGLSKFDPRTEHFYNFYQEDGLPSNQFSWAKPCAGLDGTMYFPHPNGVIVFDPDSIQTNNEIPEICITEFRINNEPIIAGIDEPIQKPVGFADDIKLAHNQNFLSFEITALNYEAPERNQYRYMMEGLDSDWIHSGNRRYAEYTNLKPGKYTFRVAGSNNNGIWNDEGTAIQITIRRPPWLSWWSVAGYVLLFMGLVHWFRMLYMNRSRAKRALEMEKVEKEKVLELDRMKSRFFMNISHEFRTPLSLITSPVEQALRSEGKKITMDREEVEMVERNAKRLHGLIDQLLDISKLESGLERLKVGQYDLAAFARSVFSNFISLAESKGIQYKIFLPSEEVVAWFDPDKAEKILVNLLNNAFKFTPPGGSIHLSLEPGEGSDSADLEYIVFKVKDTGKGISKEHMERIFDRFYQADNSDTRPGEGTGIGLALVKEMVDLYRSWIDVESEVGSGTTFTVTLPVARELFKEGELEMQTDAGSGESAPSRPDPPGSKDATSQAEADSAQEHVRNSPGRARFGQVQTRLAAEINSDLHKNGSLILVIEDNPDLRTYISKQLEKVYTVLLAENGKQGVELAKEHLPDLVISDMMMPVMDGISVCRHLKQTEETSHIPLIMLTAKVDQESRIEGLETGADDYIIKPFDVKELQVRVKNLIEQRRKLREQFRMQFTDDPGRSREFLSSEDTMLQKIIDIVEQHVPDTDFNMDDMARELNMSRSQLFRKGNAVTGVTPNDLLRNIRLREAASLFEEGETNISQVMYRVGYNNQSYFSRSFRELYAMNPSDYIRQISDSIPF